MSKKRYIVCVNDSTAEENKLFVNYLRDQNFSFWHWISNVWLVVGDEKATKASFFRDELESFFGKKRCLVIELDEGKDTWAGRGPSGTDKNMFTWLRETWSNRKPRL